MKKKIRIIKVSQQQVNKGEKTERTIWSTLLKKNKWNETIYCFNVNMW